jgi:hypothetical protein
MRKLDQNLIIETEEDDADIVIWSVFPNRHIKSLPRNLRKKTNWFFTGENTRPNFEIFDAVFSFDYSDRPNAFRLPLWWLYLDWNLASRAIHSADNRLNPYLLHLPRDIKITSEAENSVSAFIGNQTQLRKSFIDSAPTNLNFTGFGSVYGNPVPSKLALASKFEFNVCFENSYFPGYHTEKLLQAWAMNSIPLYYGAVTAIMDFNPQAFLNLSRFQGIEQFWEHIIKLTKQQKEFILNQPLLLKPLELDPLNEFLAAKLNQRK